MIDAQTWTDRNANKNAINGNHVCFFSGGLASWKVSTDIYALTNGKNFYAVFTDTLIEDQDLYRFVIDFCQQVSGIIPSEDLLNLSRSIPDVTDLDARKTSLSSMQEMTQKEFPFFVWLCDGRTPWEVFVDRKWLGNSRLAHCSFELKQKPARTYIYENFNPSDTILYLGLDWTEPHRMPAVLNNWKPYAVKFPLSEKPYYDRNQLIKLLEAEGIEVPRLYKEGFSHNNCSGQCVKGGHGHWEKLLSKFPLRYEDAVKNEERINQRLGGTHSILKRTKKGQRENLSLRQLREEVVAGNSVDIFDIGGCGCFSDSDSYENKVPIG